MRAAKSQSGAVLIELSLLLVPLLLLVFGITEFGRAIYQYNALTKGVRDGVRYLSQYAPGNDADIRVARSLVVCGLPQESCGDVKPLVPGMSADYVRVIDRISDPDGYDLQSTGRGTLNLVRIEISGFTFRSMAPAFVPDVVFGPIHATMMQAP
ncbi:TadE/TadG family type IV pilus assembly protein [Massilia sp. LjRoot122]|uniref:TadE/TadG family type IV pilus assembly protein n=1 Tax=Massilia sp. LjRoot122 TaxID=3342257 RepID=UPI003ED126CB